MYETVKKREQQTEIMGAFLVLSTSAAVIFLIAHGGLCVDIIGGKEVKPHSKPFMALLKDTNRPVCGGALIKDNWVLTAAHCKMKRGEVILGAHSVKAKEKEKQVFQIKRQIPYPCYSQSTKENDIMLVQLQKRAKFTKAVKPIKLPNSGDDPKPETTCTVAGWGKTQNQKLSDTLREVNVTVISREICNDDDHYEGDPVITDNMICAGDENGRKDSCVGDSGGPLICSGVMRGITSFGKPNKCGTADGPGIYTRLTKEYLQWIRKVIGGAE